MTSTPDKEARCVCGEPTTLGVVHRTDGPCYHAQPPVEQEARAEKALRAIAAHVPTDCPSFNAYDVVRRVAWLALRDLGIDVPYPAKEPAPSTRKEGE